MSGQSPLLASYLRTELTANNFARLEDAVVEGAILRLRPIMVATLGLLPAALSRGIGSDSQRPFAIVIVGGLLAALFISIYLLPTIYVWMARDTDKLPLGEAEIEEPA
jgi:cobalt-zinc-cadmium resistance protein CzcA